MRLLVSVRNAAEAAAAQRGRADIIDAKEPSAGALGAVAIADLQHIRNAAGLLQPVTAALGDAADAATIADTARQFASCGIAFVKVGFAGITDPTRVAQLIAAVVQGAAAGSGGACGTVAVAYADADRTGSLAFDAVLDAATTGRASGILLDTADKCGPRLLELVTPAQLAQRVADAHARGLFIALAGKLSAEDLPAVADTGADIAGVRGAACRGSRLDAISAASVQRLVERVHGREQTLQAIGSHTR